MPQTYAGPIIDAHHHLSDLSLSRHPWPRLEAGCALGEARWPDTLDEAGGVDEQHRAGDRARIAAAAAQDRGSAQHHRRDGGPHVRVADADDLVTLVWLR